MQRFERFKFLTETETQSSSVDLILQYLEAHKSIVLEFGRYGSALEAYILVANYLTRRIHQSYVERIEKALGDKTEEPPQLLITIEEAHKFLDPQIARQTIFGTIARELRKYNVTLLIVDQRPSGIDEEVMSQIGTRITALLDNERDITAVLTGINGAAGLREVLADTDPLGAHPPEHACGRDISLSRGLSEEDGSHRRIGLETRIGARATEQEDESKPATGIRILGIPGTQVEPAGLRILLRTEQFVGARDIRCERGAG